MIQGMSGALICEATMNIEIKPRILAELLENAEIGIKEIGEYSPELVHAFKELTQKLSEAEYASEHLIDFANSLSDGDEDWSFTLEPYDDEDDY
jgi:hypothetical protein